MRLFVGIALSPEVVEALERLSRHLRTADDKLRWTSPETWHITLQFLGEATVAQYGCVVPRLSAIRAPEVPVWLSGTGIFDRAGVFWAGVMVSPELCLLEKEVRAVTSGCDFMSEDRSYHPHVTLARAKGDERVRVLRSLQSRVKQQADFPAFTAQEFLLFESFLGSAGTRHEVRERFVLGRA